MFMEMKLVGKKLTISLTTSEEFERHPKMLTKHGSCASHFLLHAKLNYL